MSTDDIKIYTYPRLYLDKKGNIKKTHCRIKYRPNGKIRYNKITPEYRELVRNAILDYLNQDSYPTINKAHEHVRYILPELNVKYHLVQSILSKLRSEQINSNSKDISHS